MAQPSRVLCGRCSRALSRVLPRSLAIIFLTPFSHADAAAWLPSSHGQAVGRGAVSSAAAAPGHRLGLSLPCCQKQSTPYTCASLQQTFLFMKDAFICVMLSLNGFWPQENLGFPFSFRGSVLLQIILSRDVSQKKFSCGGPCKILQNKTALCLLQHQQNKSNLNLPCKSLLG